MKNLKRMILAFSSFLAVGNITNARYVSDYDVINNQRYIERDAHYNNKMDKKREKLSEEIRNLKNAIYRNKNNIENLEEKIRDAQSEQSELDGQYAMCVAKLDMVDSSSQRKKIKKEMNNLKTKINLIVRKIDDLRSQLENSKSKLKRQESQLDSLERKLRNL